jgi:hypothetical protein
MSVTSQLRRLDSPLRVFVDAQFPRKRVARFVRRVNSRIVNDGAGEFSCCSTSGAARIGMGFSYRAVLEHTSDLTGTPAHDGFLLLPVLVENELDAEVVSAGHPEPLVAFVWGSVSLVFDRIAAPEICQGGFEADHDMMFETSTRAGLGRVMGRLSRRSYAAGRGTHGDSCT